MEKVMLTKLTIKDLKGVGLVELNFALERSVRVMFGSNGIGKTKCLEALYRFLLFTNKTFIDQMKDDIGDDYLHAMVSAKDEVGHVTHSSFSGPPLNTYRHPGSQNRLAVMLETLHDFPILFLGASNRSSLGESIASPLLLGTFAERRARYFAGLFQVLNGNSLSGLNALGMTENIEAWFNFRAQSANPYQKQGDNRSVEIETVLEMLSTLDERIDPSFLQIDGAGKVTLKVEQTVRGLRELSSGFTSLVKLVQAIVSGYANFTNESNLRHVRGVVLIDEIESHLHAQWQSRIIPKLKALLPNTTFYIATHSPLVLAQLQEGEAYLLERDDDGVVRTHMVSSPNKRAFVDVLADAFDVDLNKLKREAMENDDQTAAKKVLLDLLDDTTGGQL